MTEQPPRPPDPVADRARRYDSAACTMRRTPILLLGIAGDELFEGSSLLRESEFARLPRPAKPALRAVLTARRLADVARHDDATEPGGGRPWFPA